VGGGPQLPRSRAATALCQPRLPHVEGKEVLAQAWWVATFPGIALALLVVGFNLTGDGMRDLFASDVASGNG
jgi:hypothetical protein